MLCCGCCGPCNSSLDTWVFYGACINGTSMGCSMARDWSCLSMAYGSMVTFTPPMLMVFVWPTFSTPPKSISLVLTTLAIGKFSFYAYCGSKFEPSQYLSFVKSQVKTTSPLGPSLAFKLPFINKCIWIIKFLTFFA
jgi:hypothetical protein